MKKIIATLLSLIMILGIVNIPAFSEETVELPTATVTELDVTDIEDVDLTFAMNFVADEVTDEQLAFYGGWYADFVLTINKDVTFNANGTKDGYLAGQYDEWSLDWVKVPNEDKEISANEPLKIMGTAGYAGVTYNDVYTSVQDFDCGVYFTDKFLAENPDLEVALELRIYNPENAEESFAIGESHKFTAPGLPTATGTVIEEEDLTFAMNFKADEVTDEQLALYGDWYADFVLTINKDVTFNANGTKDGYLAGQYDAWSLEWVKVPNGDKEISANEPLKIMGTAGYAGVTYNDVYTSVQDFDCGVYFTDEFLAENPDLEVTLELRIYNPEDLEESYAIGETHQFAELGLPTATGTVIEEEDLTFAMNFKADAVTDEQLALYGDWYADFVLTINKDVTFNANGTKDGYLAGQYDAWSDDWVKVPNEDKEISANEPLKIMGTAGYTGVTYNDVYNNVQDFDCGVYFTDEFLAKNPGLKVTLELRIYNPEDLEESFVIGETHQFAELGLPTATGAVIEEEELTFAMNFKADAVTDEQLALYGDWYADFVLTINKDVTFNANGTKDGYLAGQYDAWSDDWVKVPNEDKEISANEPLKIMGTAGYAGVTYNDVYNNVQDFDCGVYFTDEFLAENPDLEVTLELRIYNPEDLEESYTIGEAYEFEIEEEEEEIRTSFGSAPDSYTVRFATNGGSKIESVKVKRNTALQEPEAPVKEGYTFEGWYEDSSFTKEYDFNSNVKKSFTLYAKWTKIEDPEELEEPVKTEFFTDVNENDWFYNSVKYAYENNLINGISDTEFAPDATLTRSMLVTIIYRLEGEPATNRSIPYQDVDMGAYYANAVSWAHQNEIVKGISETEFAPNLNITREQLAAIFYRYLKYKRYDVSIGEDTNILSYTDVDEISEYAIPAMQYAVGSGLMKGKTNSTLNPKDNTTRAELVQILYNYSKYFFR